VPLCNISLVLNLLSLTDDDVCSRIAAPTNVLNKFLFNRLNQEVEKQDTASIVYMFMLIQTTQDLYISSSVISKYNFDI